MSTENPKSSTASESPVLLQILALRRKAKENLRGVRRKIVVTGGKGGVGKSSITANLAAVLALEGYKVGVLDADVQGASLAEMLGVAGEESRAPADPGIPPTPIGTGFHDIRVASMGACFGRRNQASLPPPRLQADAAWQSALDAGIVREFIVETAWGELDFLLVDTPPASWEILSALSGLIPDLEGALIVTQPSDAARSLLGRSQSICESLNVPVLGIVENMAHWECPHCGQEVPLFAPSGNGSHGPVPGNRIGSIPFDPRMGAAGPTGKPFAALYPESPAGKALVDLALSVVRLETEKLSALKSL